MLDLILYIIIIDFYIDDEVYNHCEDKKSDGEMYLSPLLTIKIYTAILKLIICINRKGVYTNCFYVQNFLMEEQYEVQN